METIRIGSFNNVMNVGDKGVVTYGEFRLTFTMKSTSSPTLFNVKLQGPGFTKEANITVRENGGEMPLQVLGCQTLEGFHFKSLGGGRFEVTSK
jgi:hypothetical protein